MISQQLQNQWRSQNEAEVAMPLPKQTFKDFYWLVVSNFNCWKTSVTEVVIDWPFPNKIIGCATAKSIRLRIKIAE